MLSIDCLHSLYIIIMNLELSCYLPMYASPELIESLSPFVPFANSSPKIYVYVRMHVNA